MIPLYWSFLLSFFSIAGLFVAGSRRPWGWLLCIGSEFLWIAYAICTRQWGFLLASGAYIGVYARNYAQWRGRPGGPIWSSPRTSAPPMDAAAGAGRSGRRFPAPRRPRVDSAGSPGSRPGDSDLPDAA